MKIRIEKQPTIEEIQIEATEKLIAAVKELEKGKTKKTDFTGLEEKIQRLKSQKK